MAEQPKTTVSLRLPKPMKEAIEEYAEDRELSRADAHRELLERGLAFDDLQERCAELEELEGELLKLRELLEEEVAEDESLVSRWVRWLRS